MGWILKYLPSKLTACRRRGSPRGHAENDDRESCSVRGSESSPLSVARYSWGAIEALTSGFSTVIGSGGFSTVYLGRISGGAASKLAAVKVHYGSERLHLAFKQELDILLRLRHESIVSLLGYCDNPDSGALIFEYVSNGHLQEKLHGGSEKQPVLPWRARVRIAFQLAQALEFLHDKCALHIVHGDLKSSNILLDENLNCKLCDFGFSKLGFSSTVLMPSPRSKHVMMGSPGYVDPQYLKTGIASKKNDIYSFGVVVLEMVMGLEAFCAERGHLAGLAAPALRDLERRTAEEVAEMVDPRLKGEFDVEEVRAMLHIARLCLSQSPAVRPSAVRVVQLMSEKISSVFFDWAWKCRGKTPSNKIERWY
ncbi:hypothetical protein SAY86_004190 [Trapa natans]|uniref:Protein kinase domain-containing protein n=1 Tax=Trapa natans TaxID=22666 RepID=A0AAN7M7C0_TRANT|nr:hypothetical protein SAY86_004190 [Trapa natans]